MGAAERRNKDIAMAARLRGVERKTGRCPVCYAIVPNGSHVTRGFCAQRTKTEREESK